MLQKLVTLRKVHMGKGGAVPTFKSHGAVGLKPTLDKILCRWGEDLLAKSVNKGKQYS